MLCRDKVARGGYQIGCSGWGHSSTLAATFSLAVRKPALHANSSLARLSDTKFDRGMAALRAHHTNINPVEAVTEEIDGFVFAKRA
jgi:hypothetical protein